MRAINGLGEMEGASDKGLNAYSLVGKSFPSPPGISIPAPSPSLQVICCLINNVKYSVPVQLAQVAAPRTFGITCCGHSVPVFPRDILWAVACCIAELGILFTPPSTFQWRYEIRKMEPFYVFEFAWKWIYYE